MRTVTSEIVQANRTTQTTGEFKQQLSPWWRRILRQTRSRILLLLALTMLVIAGVSLPLFLWLFLAEVDRRVQDDLVEEMEQFMTAYYQWETAPAQSITDLQDFATQHLESNIPQDDNFHIFILDGDYYKSNPRLLPPLLSAESSAMQAITSRVLTDMDESAVIRGQQPTNDPNTGTLLYLAKPLRLEDEIRGVFVVAHTTAGERNEALAGVYILSQLTVGIVGLSMLISWFTIGKLLAPLQSLTVTARSISQSDLSQRLAVRGTDELAELASTFNSMMDRLQSAFTSQRNFINDAGHELRTPITIILGNLEVMGDTLEDQQETHELVIDELMRMSRIVNDLILLSKSDRSDFLQVETIDLEIFTQELFTKTQALADRNWQMNLQSQGQFMGDRQRLTGAIMNLLHNAAQHTSQEDLIELGSKITGQGVRFWVRDTGEGISPADQTRIFKRFARAGERGRNSDGAGLGLAIVQAITEAHGGHVELESQLGEGSLFVLVLPLRPPQRHHTP
jgi:signal transduction histidine kinase